VSSQSETRDKKSKKKKKKTGEQKLAEEITTVGILTAVYSYRYRPPTPSTPDYVSGSCCHALIQHGLYATDD
jgi:hypothetical protein